MNREAALQQWTLLPASGALLVLLALALLQLGGSGDPVAPAGLANPLPTTHPALAQMDEYFGWPREVRWEAMTNLQNPFFTLAIQPQPPQAPPPPPPKTRVVAITYRGFFETSAGIRQAVVQVADRQVLGAQGDKVVADYVIAEIGLQRLTLTNAAGSSQPFEFTKQRSLEIPLP